jgi:hypothetical protein
LGVGVAGYLSALLSVLLWADAWTYAVLLPTAASVGVLGAAGAVVLAWTRPKRLAGVRHRLGRGAVPSAVALVALTAVPAAATASLSAGPPAAVSPEVRKLSAEHRADAPLPPDVRADLKRADRLESRAAHADERAQSARNHWHSLVTARDRATSDAERANRSIKYWTTRLTTAQQDYDRFQALLDEPIIDPEIDGEADAPSIDGPSITPPILPPTTTEDFGSGSGRVGLCRDGTVSDSIGRPGACSHHGGVAN